MEFIADCLGCQAKGGGSLSKPDLLVIVGPTAVGKTALSVRLAQLFSGEILSGDSTQVYRGMDIGTAKVTPDEQQDIPHHLIDICNPDENFSVSQFQELATQTIAAIHKRNHLPILVGGTGLYVEAVVYGYHIPKSGQQPQLREQLEKEDAYALHARLEAVDPLSAARIHPHNRRRVIRALEVYLQTGRPFSAQTNRRKPRYKRVLWLGLTMPRSLLYQRINQRVEEMLAQGWLDEVEKLQKQGYHTEYQSMRAIGYRELAQVLAGEMTLQEAIPKIQQATRKYAKRQLTWFRRIKEIRWFDRTQPGVEKEIEHWIAGECNAYRE
jgi:tRNA dimethylallyltransferase